MTEGPNYGFDTLQVHAGARPDPATGARNTPIYQTTAYVFRDAEHAAALFNLQEVGYIYSRLTNPTVAVLQERIATLEGGAGAVCCSSGHAAQIMALFPLMRPGMNVVASTRLYGGTITQFSQTIKRFGWEAKFVDFDDLDAVKAAIDEGLVPVVAGSQGMSTDKDVTFLGRGGSDTTAVALARALDAEMCELYTDVSGVFSADPPLVTKAPKIYHETCQVNFNGSTLNVHNFIRGMSPYPTAWTMLDGLKLKLFRSEKEIIEPTHPVGTFVSDNKHFLKVATQDGYVKLLDIQLQGRKRMAVK